MLSVNSTKPAKSVIIKIDRKIKSSSVLKLKLQAHQTAKIPDISVKINFVLVSLYSISNIVGYLRLCFIYIYIYIYISVKVKLANLVKGDPKPLPFQ